jgi:predicted metal-dependent hydrolase
LVGTERSNFNLLLIFVKSEKAAVFVTIQAMSSESEQPLLVAFVSDFFFAPKLEQVARQLGYRLQWVETADSLGPAENEPTTPRPGEPITGRAAILVEKLTQWQPALLIFDLGSEAIPWRQWLPILKSSPATRRLPALCFGPHVDVDTMQKAKELGADAVVARSRFASALPELIQKYARIPDRAALADACQHPLSPLAIQGLESFNHGRYFEAHEELEHAWNEDQSPGRDLYRAVLQIAVAYLQIERGNYNGAVKMFLRARQWFEPLPPVCRGINLGRLRQEAQQAHQHLLELGPQQIQSFDRSLFRPVEYTH